MAVQSGDLEEVKHILHVTALEGEDVGIVDQRNEQSHAPLHLACATGNMYGRWILSPSFIVVALSLLPVFVHHWPKFAMPFWQVLAPHGLD